MPLIDLDRLVDPETLKGGQRGPWTFLAFPRDSVGSNGVPVDLEAQEFIAAIQTAGIPVGIWVDSPTRDVAYAFVCPDHFEALHKTLETILQSGRFSPGYAERLTDRLLGGHYEAGEDFPKVDNTKETRATPTR